MMPKKFPNETPEELNAFYGNPDSNKNGEADRMFEISRLGVIVPPYPMVLAWDRQAKVKSFRANIACMDQMLAALIDIRKMFQWSDIVKYGLNEFGGAYNFRPKRVNIKELSTHAWGCAIDLSPTQNRLGCKPKMPKEVVMIFKKHGAEWGGDWGRPDGMHFQFCKSINK